MTVIFYGWVSFQSVLTLEADINPNPLREAFEICRLGMRGKGWQCTDAPGLGIERLPDALDGFQTAYVQL